MNTAQNCEAVNLLSASVLLARIHPGIGQAGRGHSLGTDQHQQPDDFPINAKSHPARSPSGCDCHWRNPLILRDLRGNCVSCQNAVRIVDP
jgi:hypothetical protein